MAITNDKSLQRVVREIAITKLRSDGKSETQIANILNINQSTVNRCLARTIHGRYVFEPKIPSSMTMPELTSMMDQMMNKGEFRTAIKDIAKNPALMIDVAVHKSQHENFAAKGFLPRTGQLLSRLLERTEGYIGVTWGNEIRPYDLDIPGFVKRKPSQPPLKFIPLCGINEGNANRLSRSSTVLATRYSRLVNKGYDNKHTRPRLYNMNGLPVMHRIFNDSDQLDREKTEAILDYVEETNPDAVAIYGRRKEPHTTSVLINQVDTILTSVGEAGEHLRDHLDTWFPTTDTFNITVDGKVKQFDKDFICHEVSVGDIAGPILPKPGPDYQRNRTICNAINANLATLKPEHLSRCFERSRKRQLEYLEQVLSLIHI